MDCCTFCGRWQAALVGASNSNACVAFGNLFVIKLTYA